MLSAGFWYTCSRCAAIVHSKVLVTGFLTVHSDNEQLEKGIRPRPVRSHVADHIGCLLPNRTNLPFHSFPCWRLSASQEQRLEMGTLERPAKTVCLHQQVFMSIDQLVPHGEGVPKGCPLHRIAVTDRGVINISTASGK